MKTNTPLKLLPFRRWSVVASFLLGLVFLQSSVGQQVKDGVLRGIRKPALKLPDSTQTIVVEEVESVFKKREDGAYHFESQTGNSTLIATMGSQEKKVEDYKPTNDRKTEYWLKLIPHEETVFLKCVSLKEGDGDGEGKVKPVKFEGIYEMMFRDGSVAELRKGMRVVLALKPGEHDRFVTEMTAQFRDPATLADVEARAKEEYVSSFHKALDKRPEVFLPPGLDSSQIEEFKERIARVSVDATVTFTTTPSTFTIEGETLQWSTDKQEYKSLFQFSLPSSAN